MATVKIYKYETVNTKLGNPRLSTRMGTAEHIEKRTNGWKVEGSEMEVDASKVDKDGKTEEGFTG
jgi:hypothetical protein